jgi:hypothetical protein
LRIKDMAAAFGAGCIICWRESVMEDVVTGSVQRTKKKNKQTNKWVKDNYAHNRATVVLAPANERQEHNSCSLSSATIYQLTA